jgi:DNA-directed RNA polymerase beta' subunit
MGGVSIGIEDLEIPTEKETLLEEAEERVERFQRAYNTGNITNGERYNKVIDTWTHANNDVADAMVKAMRESKNGFNPVFMMFDSGSRGSRDQIRQLAGMRNIRAVWFAGAKSEAGLRTSVEQTLAPIGDRLVVTGPFDARPGLETFRKLVKGNGHGGV